jgi:S-(hydroxymethyl)glutathione dehydrogenase/alcohol dehydrogenase
MKAVVYTGPNQFSVEELTLDPPKAGEVRVKMAACGVCHSDLSVINGTIPMPAPCALGHEGSGVVEEVGEGVSNVAVGDHVILTFVPNCGTCFHCIRDEAHLCIALPPGGMQADGTTRLHMGDQDVRAMTALGCMAEEIVCPAISVVPIDKDIPLTSAALVGCGVTTGVGAAIKTAKVTPGSTVAVFGCGGVGLSVIQGARLAGADKIVAVDLSENKLAMAEKFGATATINADKVNPVEALKEMTGGMGVDFAFEAIGIPSVVEQAYDATRRGGTTTVVGVGKLSETVSFNALLLSLHGKTIKGSMYGNVNPRVDFPRLLALAEHGKLDLEGMVTRTYSIDQAVEAFEDLKDGKNARGVIVF